MMMVYIKMMEGNGVVDKFTENSWVRFMGT